MAIKIIIDPKTFSKKVVVEMKERRRFLASATDIDCIAGLQEDSAKSQRIALIAAELRWIESICKGDSGSNGDEA